MRKKISSNEASERKTGRFDDILIYIGGIICIVMILIFLWFAVYIPVRFAMLP